MTLKEIFEAAASVIARKAKEKPDVKLKKGDIEFTYKQLSDELKNLASWCYKGEIDITKVIRCRSCKNYEPCNNQGRNRKTRKQMICKLDSKQKSPEHFCAYGERRE